ncbi:MAG: recombinase family protein [Bacteroidales bacterium]|nr:recombinase family protein [Bacteroidales bacterium]
MYHFYNYAEMFKPEEILDYLRKSQSDDPLLTVAEVLAKHEAILDEWDERHLGQKVPEENRFREVVSGETIKERPEINKVLRLIESPKIKAVKVVEPQRLTRGDLEDIGRLMKLLKHTNTYVITPERMYDLRDEYDWNAFEAELKRGNDYLKYTKKILNRGRLLSVSQGNYLGTIPPYGYDKTHVMDGKRKCPTLKENKEQADVVRMIFDMYVNQDMGRTRICHQLDKMGIKPPKGEHWSPPALKDMLENVHLIGKVKWNWRKTMTIVEDGEIIQTRPKAKIGEYLIYEGRHDGIISEELFQAARDKQGKNHRAKAKTKVRNPLAGLLYCRCGRAMSLRTYKNKDGTEKNPARLLCDDQVHCKSGSVLYEEMIDRVCQILQQCIEDFEIRLQNDEGDSIKLHAKLISNLEKRMKDIESRELAQWEQQSHPDPSQRMPAEIFRQLNERLLKEKEEVRQALCDARQSMPEPVDYEEKMHRFKDALEALRNPEVDAELKNRLLKACVDRIDYSREKPERIPSQQVRYYDPEQKRTRNKSPLNTGGNWTSPPIELDVKLKV